MFKLGLFSILFFLGWGAVILSSAHAEEQKIRMISLDQSGKLVETLETQEDYTHQVGASIATFQNSLLPTLAKYEETTPSTLSSKKTWSLHRITVGTGLGFEVGSGLPAKIAIFPRFKMIFSKGTN